MTNKEWDEVLLMPAKSILSREIRFTNTKTGRKKQGHVWAIKSTCLKVADSKSVVVNVTPQNIDRWW